MEKNESESLLRAAMSEKTAQLDGYNYKIKTILGDPKPNSIEEISELFDKITMIEMSLSAMATFYQRTFGIEKEVSSDEK